MSQNVRTWRDPVTENPGVGDTQIWELYNATADAHPKQDHEVTFEVVDREGLVMDGEDPVLRWTESTALRPVLQALGETASTAFKEAYALLLREAYPRRPDGTTLYPFARLFIVATSA